MARKRKKRLKKPASKRFRFLVRCLSFLLWPVVCGWLKSIRIRTESSMELDPNDAAVIAFWHEHIVALSAWVMQYSARDHKPNFLISASKDGEYGTALVERFGGQVIRGSASRGGLKLFKQILRALEAGDLFMMASDGPTGPKRVFKMGTIQIANAAKVPIYALSVQCDNAWRLNTWDKMWIPKPFSQVKFVVEKIPHDTYQNWTDAEQELMAEKLSQVSSKC